MDSGEEVGLCVNSIYGRDIDSLSWDFGMTDGNSVNKMILYAYRAARLALVEDSLSQPGNVRHRPSLFGIHINDRNHEALQTMSVLGMTVLGMDMMYMKNGIQAAFPDMLGMTDEQIAQQPPYIQYYKCNGAVESGDPGCT